MTPSEKLHAHHEKLIGTIRNLADRAAADPAESSLLVPYCSEYLVAHAEAEEVTLYRVDEDIEFVKNMIHEHREIKHSLELISNAYEKGETPVIPSMVRNFMALLEKHFREEEETLMPRLSRTISQENLETLIVEAHQIEAEKKKADLWNLFEFDHKRIDICVDRLRRSVGEMESARKLYSVSRARLLKHIELEETVLFAAFGEHAEAGQMGPVQVMIAEHREITSLIGASSDSVDEKALPSLVDTLIGKLAVHNKKEELILYPLINRSMPRGEREKVFKVCFGGFASV